MQSNSQSFAEPRIEDSILFDVNEKTLADMNLTEHVCRLEMGRFLGDALNKNRSNLLELRQLVKGQINSLKNSSQLLQSNIREETINIKNIFEPAVSSELKKIGELKVEVGKINAEQLTTKKYILNLEANRIQGLKGMINSYLYCQSVSKRIYHLSKK